MYRVSRKAAADSDSQVEVQAYGWRKLLVSSQLVELKSVCFGSLVVGLFWYASFLS
jgi:hypothetical protein